MGQSLTMLPRPAAGAIAPHIDVTHCDARGGAIRPAASSGSVGPPPARPARAAMFATVCMMLAIAGHVAAGRAAVAPRAIVVGCVALYLVAWVLTGTERSLATILGGLLGGQFMLHALFAAAAVPSAVAPAARMLGAHSVHPGAPTGAMTAMTSMTVKPPGRSLGGGLTL